MKTTKDEKSQIVQMIKEGTSLDEIARLFKISNSSVKRLKYSEVKKNSERITCEICHGEFKQLTDKHLKGHNLSLFEYKILYPNSETATIATLNAHHEFKSKNKGKTFEEIYGETEGAIKREKISQKQIGRPSPVLAGTGLSGTRKDTGTYARSTYEANLDRIFQFENKQYADEFSELNPRVFFNKNGSSTSYQPDRVDLGGLFQTGASIEVKGYMNPEDWGKICLFRENYPNQKLIVISPDRTYADILYTDLQNKYKPLIPLWETSTCNIKTRPEIYQVNYIGADRMQFISENYQLGINNGIQNSHERFIASKCISYGAVAKGLDLLVDKVELENISNRRKGASKKSSGEFNFEKWIIHASEQLSGSSFIFYVVNLNKTNVFYCHDHDWTTSFFEDNSDMTLLPGRKNIKTHENIDENLWATSDENTRYILQMVNDKLKHRGIFEIINNIKLIHSQVLKSKCARRNMEKWEMTTDNQKIYFLDNFDGPTDNYVLTQ